MLQLLKNPIEPIFMNLLNETNDKVILCSPFIKKDIIKKILHNKKDNTNITVITSSNIASFVRRASDVEAIELLLANNIKFTIINIYMLKYILLILQRQL